MSLDRTDYKVMADKLWPYLSTRANGSTGSSGNSSNGSMSAHDLAGSYHTGSLARSQAPWVTQDITDHKNLPDAHHSRLHSYFSTADHSFPTAAAMDVIGFTAANVPGKLTPASSPGASEKLLKTDSNGFVAVQRLTATNELFVGNSYFTTDIDFLRYEGPKSFYITANSPSTYIYSPNIYLGYLSGTAVHLRGNALDTDDSDISYPLGRSRIGNTSLVDHAVFSHRDLTGVNDYALAHYVDGNTYLNGSAGKGVYHHIGGSSVFVTVADRLLPASSMLKDFGDYNRKWRTGFFAELYVETLVAQDVLATIGGRIMVAPTSKLVTDITSAAGNVTLRLEHNSFVVNEYLFMMAAPGGIPQIEAFKVISGPTGSAGDYSYVCSRGLDGTPSNAWVIGDAVVSLGSAAGHGYIDITSTKTIHNHFGPTITHYVRSSTASWNSVAPVVTSGNLRSFVDYTTNEFGIAAGNDLTLTPSSGFKGYTMDRTAGLRLFNTHIELYTGANKIVELDQTNGLTFAYGTGALNKVRWLSGANETLEIGSYDAFSISHGFYIARPKQSGWDAAISIQIKDFAGGGRNQVEISNDLVSIDSSLTTRGLHTKQNLNTGDADLYIPLTIEHSVAGYPMIWFKDPGDVNNVPEVWSTAGSLWKYIAVKVGNTQYKIPIYNFN